jgi:hypothetical protein
MKFYPEDQIVGANKEGTSDLCKPSLKNNKAFCFAVLGLFAFLHSTFAAELANSIIRHFHLF